MAKKDEFVCPFCGHAHAIVTFEAVEVGRLMKDSTGIWVDTNNHPDSYNLRPVSIQCGMCGSELLTKEEE